MKKIFTIFLVVVVLVAGLIIAKNTLAKVSVEKGVELVTGLKLGIGHFDLSLMKTFVDIEELELMNPKTFPEPTMVNIPKIYVDYNLQALTQGRIHLEEVEIHLREFNVVKNKTGELNLDSLKALQKEGEAPKEKKAGEAPKIQIDSLHLKIEKVFYKDYSKGGEPSVKEFNIDLDQSYQNIDDPSKLVRLIVLKALMGTTIASLTNFDVAGLQGSLSDVLASSTDMARQAADKTYEALKGTQAETQQVVLQAQEGIKGVTGLLGETTKSFQEGLQDTTSGLTSKLKLPFGKSSD